MATVGPSLPTTGASVNQGLSVPWTNPGNITAEDGTSATVVSATGSDELRGAAFGWSGLTGLTVSNVLVEMKAQVGAGTDAGFGYINDGTYGSANSDTFDTSLTWRTIFNGAPSAGYAAAVVANTDTYGFASDSSTGVSWSVDAIRVTITYSLGGLPNQPGMNVMMQS